MTVSWSAGFRQGHKKFEGHGATDWNSVVSSKIISCHGKSLSSSHRLLPAMALYVLSLSHGGSFTQGQEAGHRNREPGVTWILWYNSNITPLTESLLYLLALRKSLRLRSKNDAVCPWVHHYFTRNRLHISCSWHSVSVADSDLRISAVCQNKALIGWLTGVPKAHWGDQPSKSWACEQFELE